MYSNKLYEYNPQNNSWIELAQMPNNFSTNGEVVNGKLYTVGGYNGTVSNKIYIYDIDSNTWESEIMMPIGISANRTAIVGSKIYSVGDFSNQTLVVNFDTTTNNFIINTSNLIARRNCAVEGVNEKLFVLGGNTESNIESAISSVQVSDNLLSINNLILNQKFFIFPNPSVNKLNFSLEFNLVDFYDLN